MVVFLIFAYDRYKAHDNTKTVHGKNAWDHGPLLATKTLAFYDSDFPPEARVISDSPNIHRRKTKKSIFLR